MNKVNKPNKVAEFKFKLSAALYLIVVFIFVFITPMVPVNEPRPIEPDEGTATSVY